MILKEGGKKALKAYNDKKRATLVQFNTETRTVESKKYKDPKHKGKIFDD